MINDSSYYLLYTTYYWFAENTTIIPFHTESIYQSSAKKKKVSIHKIMTD